MNTTISSFRKTMALEAVDQVPVIPIVSSWVARFSGISPKPFMRDPEAMAKAQIAAQKAVGYDALFVYCFDPQFIPEAFGCSLVSLSSGVLVPSPLDLKSEEDVKALPIPDVRKNGRLPVMLELAERLVGLPGRAIPVLGFMEGPFTTCARIIDTEKIMKAVLKNRPLVERLQEKVLRALIQYGQALEGLGVDGLVVADPVGSSTMVSTKIYRELVLSALKLFTKSVKIPVILHVCGDTEPILDMMAETGAKILSLDQCMDLVMAKQKLGGRCGIGGNVDPINALLFGTVEDVKQETLRCLNEGGKTGYVLMAGCAVPPSTRIENLRAMIETARIRP